MNKKKETLWKTAVALIAIIVIFSIISRLLIGNSKTLYDYATENPSLAYKESSDSSETADSVENDSEGSASENLSSGESEDSTDNSGNTPSLIGATLNGNTMINFRYQLQENFYYEPLSDNLIRYITGISYPTRHQALQDDTPESEQGFTQDSPAESSQEIASADTQAGDTLPPHTETEDIIPYEDLAYVHVLHYDFEGKPTEGELICNKAIASDLLSIFSELYRNEYRIEKIRLIEEYDGDDNLSMADNNTSCFNYRNSADSETLSKHAYGLAVDINPLYNPYITYNEDYSLNVSPKEAEAYADRSTSFPYKIDENDLCYKLFTKYGFTWGGNWNSRKDYQHFQKTLQ